jgi:hypothetical protein
MSEGFEFPKKKETIEQKKERLTPIFDKSFEVMRSPEMDLEEGILEVTRELQNGKLETIGELMVMEMTEDGPNLARIDENGDPSSSATMLWKELVDAKFMYK